MDTVKEKGVTYHIRCGGIVIKGICVKCGEKRKRDIIKKIFGEGPLILKEEDEKEIKRKEHRKRLQERRDIWK